MIVAGDKTEDVMVTGIGIPSALIGMWIFLSTVAMLFAAFLSAYLVRRAAADWVPVTLPGVLWASSAILIASSGTLEGARAACRNGQRRAAARWLLATTVLGFLFLAAQAWAWRRLVEEGVYLPTSPHSSFFYIFTGLHALHLLGGLVFLVFVAGTFLRGGREERRSDLVSLCATYWHFLGGLWLFLFIVLLTL
jgi:cytochrome c oxidase subunit III